jgi:hypothetical protein
VASTRRFWRSSSSPRDWRTSAGDDVPTVSAGGISRRATTSSSSATRRKTGSQSPRRCWRKRRAEGYHGESARASPQRQSGALGSASQKGTPNAPARCAAAVSTDTTRSRFTTAAAVSAKSCQPAAPMSSAPAAASSSADPSFIRLTSRTPGILASGVNSVGATERILSPA